MTATLQITKQKCRGSLSSTSERVMGLEPTISCLGSKRSTTELHPHIGRPELYRKAPSKFKMEVLLCCLEPLPTKTLSSAGSQCIVRRLCWTSIAIPLESLWSGWGIEYL